MNKKVIIFAILSAFSFSGYCQSENRIQNIHSGKLTILGASYAYEHSLFEQAVLNIELILIGGFGNNYIYGEYWVVVPNIRIEPRYYYNFNKRILKEKNNLNNAANYIGLSIDYQPSISIGENAQATEYLSFVPKYGIRRNIFKFLYFEGAIGIGVFLTRQFENEFDLSVDIKLGFPILKK